MVCDGVLCAILQPIYIFSSWTNPWQSVKCSSILLSPFSDSEHISKAIYSNFRQLKLQETSPKSFSWQFPEIGPMWRYLKQVLIHSTQDSLSNFSLLKHPFWDPKSFSLFLCGKVSTPSHQFCSCPLNMLQFVYISSLGTTGTIELLHVKSSQNPGDQN